MTVRPAHALSNRMTSLMLVMLLHGLLLMLLLHAFTQNDTRPLSPRETILRLLPLLQRAPLEEAAPSAGAAPRARPMPAPAMPPAITTTPAAPDVTGLGRQLFGCAPERLATLSPEDRARCATGLKAPDRSVVTFPKSHVQDPARRAAELKAKNSPPRIPCTYAGSAPAPHGTAVAVMVDPVCAMDGLFNGFAPLTGLPK
jgi:hypothetical protein